MKWNKMWNDLVHFECFSEAKLCETRNKVCINCGRFDECICIVEGGNLGQSSHLIGLDFMLNDITG